MSDISLGSIIYTSVRPIFKLYFIIGTGFFLAKKNWLSVETLRNLSNMVLIVLTPCLIVDRIITYISDSDIKQIGIIVLSAFVTYSTGFFYACLASLVLPVPKKWKGGFIAGCTLPNVSDLPIAYVQSMAGGVIFSQDDANKGVAYIIIYLATYIWVQFTLGLFRLVEYDFRDQVPDNEKEIAESSEEELIENDTEEEDGHHQQHHHQEVDLINRAAIGNQRLDANGLPLLDNASVPLSPTSTLSSASSDVAVDSSTSNLVNPHVNNAELQVIPLDRPLKVTVSNASSGMRMRRSSIGSRSLRSIRSRASSNNELVREYSRLEPINSHLTVTQSIITENVSSEVVKKAGAGSKFVQKYKLNWLVFMLKNFLKPASIALVFSITMAMIPWCKALFVHTTAYVPNAPDQQPPLSFVLDYANYLGQACVPIGLLLLGATIARLQVETIPPKFWQCCLLLTFWRLVMMPIWGVLWCERLKKAGWIDGDNLLIFIITLEWGLPSATIQIYMTATYTDPEAEDHIQMDCLAIYIMTQYCVLIVSLPILVSYTLRASLGY